MPSKHHANPTIAIDARLIGGTSTGDSTYWSGLIEGFAEVQPDARILLLSNTERPSTIPSSFEWVQVPAKSSRWWSLVSFPMAARKLGVDLIHTQYSLSPLVGNRGVTTVHDVSFFIGPEWFPARHRLLLSRTVPAACRRAAAVITVSETSKREIESWIPTSNGKVHVTPNACPSWIQRVDPEDARQLVSDELGVAGPFILTVGTRWPRKNMNLVLDAVAQLSNENPVRLVVTGKAGWGEERLGSRGVAVGYVSNTQLSALYSAASLYLAPSRHEGFGIPALEAMRCGCPVLCSTGGALPEVVADAAEIESSWEPDVWAARIQGLLADSSKLSDLRQRGYQRESRFSWSRTARETLAVYRGALN